jgi:hypothetical protein
MMKTHVKNIAGFCLLFLAAVSCEKDETRVVAVPGAPAILSVTGSAAWVCTEENASDTVCTFTWTPADYGAGIACNYAMQFDAAGGSFANPYSEIVGSNVYRKAYSSDHLNTVMNKLGLPAGEATGISIRVKAEPVVLGSPESHMPPLISGLSALTLTSYLKIVDPLPPLHLIGNVLGSQVWNNVNYEYVMFRDHPLATDEYVARFQAGAFKFIGQASLGAWEGLYGVPDDQPGVLSTSGGDIKDIATAGYYTVTADITGLAYTVTPYDAGSAKTFGRISIIGNGVGGWNDADDVFMTQTDYDPHIWIVDNVSVVADELKFRAEQDWEMNWGSDTFPYGKGVQGGNNIMAAEAGTYFVKFNDLTGQYVFYKK